MTNQAAIYTLNPPQQGVHRAKVFMEDNQYWVMLLNEQGKCICEPFYYRLYMDALYAVVPPPAIYKDLAKKILDNYMSEFRPPPQQRTMNFDEPKKEDDMV